MNACFLAAGCLATGATFVHAVLGELWILRKLDPAKLAPTASGDGAVTKTYLRGIWHLVTVNLAVSAAVLLRAALAGPDGGAAAALVPVVALLFTGYTAVVVGLLARTPILFLRIPQSIAIAAIAALTWLGLFR